VTVLVTIEVTSVQERLQLRASYV